MHEESQRHCVTKPCCINTRHHHVEFKFKLPLPTQITSNQWEQATPTEQPMRRQLSPSQAASPRQAEASPPRRALSPPERVSALGSLQPSADSDSRSLYAYSHDLYYILVLLYLYFLHFYIIINIRGRLHILTTKTTSQSLYLNKTSSKAESPKIYIN